MFELLWNERRVESYELTHRISIPLAGPRLSADWARRIGLTLSAWWAHQPGLLSDDTEVTYVGAEVRSAPLAPTELVVTLTTAAPSSAAQVANLRTIRDLRRAVREVRLGAALVDQGLALAA